MQPKRLSQIIASLYFLQLFQTEMIGAPRGDQLFFENLAPVTSCQRHAMALMTTAMCKRCLWPTQKLGKLHFTPGGCPPPPAKRWPAVASLRWTSHGGRPARRQPAIAIDWRWAAHNQGRALGEQGAATQAIWRTTSLFAAPNIHGGTTFHRLEQLRYF